MAANSRSATKGATSQQTVFGYDASMAMAWIGGIVFTIMFVIHAFQYVHYRSLYLYLLMLGIASKSTFLKWPKTLLMLLKWSCADIGLESLQSNNLTMVVLLR